jgi:type VI protein secretion system component VasF
MTIPVVFVGCTGLMVGALTTWVSMKMLFRLQVARALEGQADTIRQKAIEMSVHKGIPRAGQVLCALIDEVIVANRIGSEGQRWAR